MPREWTARLAGQVAGSGRPPVRGKVARIAGLLIEASMPGASMGDLVEIERLGRNAIGEVVGFRDGLARVVPLTDLRGLRPGARVRLQAAPDIPVGNALLGRVVDALGEPIDGGGSIACSARAALDAPAPPIASRGTVSQRFDTGVRAIDGLLTCGRGQRIGIFAGAGVGKSVLVEQIAAQSRADVVVVGLIGERGREVRDLMESERRSSMVVVAATSDRSPMERARGALATTAIAEHFRERGANVLLVLDSVTRYAMALREIGLSAGEPPATKGYPPSVFAALPRLFERCAPLRAGGSITGVYTVLVEGDDLADPIADSARSLLDAHIVLSRDLAARGHFPAIDILASASRVALQVTSAQERDLALLARQQLATRQEARELQSLGAYRPGAHPAYDAALAYGERLDAWLRQDQGQPCRREDALAALGVALKDANSGLRATGQATGQAKGVST